MNTISLDGDRLPIRTDIRISAHNWTAAYGMDSMRDVRISRQNGRRISAGKIEIESNRICRIQQILSESNGIVDLSFTITAETDLDLDGVYFWLDAPISAFAGGVCDLLLGSNYCGSAVMPREQPRNRHLLITDSSRIVISGVRDNGRLEVAMDHTYPTVIQDNREFKSDTYSAFCLLAVGPLAKGANIPIHATIKLTGEADHSPAKLTVSPSRLRYRLDGFGGNYCFDVRSPVTQFTLDNLHIAWARTEMKLSDWEPQNSDNEPAEMKWKHLKSNDQPNSDLRRDFLLARQIQDRGISYVISIWYLPEWMYVDPGRGREAFGRCVAPDKWPAVVESIGSYLLYARQEYGVEPNLFSFNEPEAGVRVWLSPEEHRDAIKLIGARLEKLGLKTKMLLGDTASPRGTHVYALPTANDADAMRYVGAISFHSWGGATPEQYKALSDLAISLKLPLLVAELGVDAGAWRTGTFRSFDYGLREAQVYQELLLYAQPQGTMQWQFTSDYGIADEVKDGAGRTINVAPTSRFWFVKHFCNLTPPRSDALATTSDQPRVFFTAFSAQDVGKKEYTFHILNTGAGRRATVSGMPKNLGSLRAIRTGESDSFAELVPASVRSGTVTLDLTPQSLLTLTTLLEQ